MQNSVWVISAYVVSLDALAGLPDPIYLTSDWEWYGVYVGLLPAGEYCCFSLIKQVGLLARNRRDHRSSASLSTQVESLEVARLDCVSLLVNTHPLPGATLGPCGSECWRSCLDAPRTI